MKITTAAIYGSLTVVGGSNVFINTISPLSISANQVLTIFGSGFKDLKGIVYVDNKPMIVLSWTDTIITCVVSNLVSFGNVSVAVVNVDGEYKRVDNILQFTISNYSEYYYPRTIENVTTKFIDLFNGIVVKKYDNNGDVTQIIPVPVMWGPVDKFYQIRKENYNETNEPYYQKLPIISVFGPSLTYNNDRATSVNEIRDWYNDESGVDITDFYEDAQSVCYDFGYEVKIRTNKMEQLNQILESILPYYNPTRFLRVKEFSFLNIERDLKVTFGGEATSDFSDPYEINTNRIIECTLNFTIDAFLYLPVATSKIIKIIDSKYFIVNSQNDESTIDANYITSGYGD